MKIFFQVDIFMNGQHVETFEEDFSLASDVMVSPEELHSHNELKGMTFINIQHFYM